MTKPDIALLTLCDKLAAELQDGLQAKCSVTIHHLSGGLDRSLRRGNVSGIIADFRHVSGGGHDEDRVLSRWRDQNPDLPVIVIAAETCPETLKRHAACDEHTRMIQAADPVEILELLSQLTTADSVTDSPETTDSPADDDVSELASSSDTVLCGITRRFDTRTPQMKEMLLDLQVAAQHDVTVLLIGETGSGKTFLSRLIHEVSPRREKPFVTVACGALPGDLIESELFGHVKGSFTSAHADKDGKFLAAGDGTILLDEIDVLTPEQQVKLLRVIETGEFEPVGSNQTLKCHSRLVVASNLDLQPLVEQGRFRPDLYYRLNMLKFEVAPLRKRRRDIAPLTHQFVQQLSQKHGTLIKQIEDDFFETLNTYPWPGNVRELENVIQRAVIYCRDGVLTAAHLPRHILLGQAGPVNDASVNLSGEKTAPSSRTADEDSLNSRIACTEQKIIEQALLSNNFSRTKTARALGISRVTLYNKMKKYAIA